MKLNSYLKRANAVFKLSQKVTDNVTFDLNTRYTNTPMLGDESTSSGSGSILSSSYRFRPIATDQILGDKGALLTGNIIDRQYRAIWKKFPVGYL